jgi:SAM-dependent methyltransferase
MTLAEPQALYERALAGGPMRMRLDGGPALPFDVAPWLGPATAADEAVLEHAVAPVLDIGCGPGRHVGALARRGVDALGLDASPDAVGLARARHGATAVAGSVFDHVPGAGSWATALLLDGNIGIEGCPMRLLRRVLELLAPGGRVLVETSGPGRGTRVVQVRLEDDDDHSPAFPWALVGHDGLPAIARAVGLRRRRAWTHSGRWFAELA